MQVLEKEGGKRDRGDGTSGGKGESNRREVSEEKMAGWGRKTERGGKKGRDAEAVALVQEGT